MRFCVSGRQPYSVIKRADEIKFTYNDRDRILDLVEKYPDKTVILDVPSNEGDWKLWEMYSEKFNEFFFNVCTLDYQKLSDKIDSLTDYDKLVSIVPAKMLLKMVAQGIGLATDDDYVDLLVKLLKQDSSFNALVKSLLNINFSES